MSEDDLLTEFLDEISCGTLDEKLDEISDHIEKRREVLRERLMKMVKRLYGEDAEISTASSQAAHALIREVEPKNPFIQKASETPVGPQQPPGLPQRGDPFGDGEPADMQTVSDPFLAGRGAIISGMRPEDMNGIR